MGQTKIAMPLTGNIMGSTESSFAVAEWSAPGAVQATPCMIAPLHLHHRDDEAWYVLEGRLCVLSGEETVELRAGSGLLVPRGTKHTYWNPGSEPARYLLLMTPTILGLIQALHTLPDRKRETLAALFEKYDSALLD